MNVLEKILEEMKKIKDGNRKEKLYGKYPPQNKRQETLNAYSQGNEDGTDNFYNAIIPIIRSHMDEASDMHGKRLIDANALDEEVRNFFLTIIGDPSQSTVVRECKESFRRIIDEQPTVYEANDWIPVEEWLPKARQHDNGEPIEFIAMIKGAGVPTVLSINEQDEWFSYDEMFYGEGRYNNYDVVAWQPLPEPIY
jgi:hypothetical protein